MKFIFILTVCLLAGLSTLTAQQEDSTAVVLTLDDAVALALEKSYDARVDRLDLLASQQLVRAQKGRFRTQVNLRMDSPNFSESVQSTRLPNEVPFYNTVGTMQWRSLLNITQPLPTDGSIGLRSELYQVRESVFQDQTDITEKDKRFFSSFRLELRQPLFVPNTLRMGMERANLQHELAQRRFNRTELEVVYQVTAAFYTLYSATRTLEIAGEEVRQQEQSFDLARRKFEAGLIPEGDALQMEVDLAQSRSRQLQAQGDLSRTRDRFKMTVGLPLDKPVAVQTSFEIRTFNVDEEKALEYGLRNRAEIREAQINSRLAEITLKETDARSAIRGDITAYYDLTGISDPLLDYSSSSYSLFRSSMDDLKQRPRNRGVTFTVSLPLWDSGVNRAEVAAARATLNNRELTLEENRRLVTQQVRASITRLIESRDRLEVLKKTEEVAVKSFQISQARFDNGDMTGQELALDRDRLTLARQNYLNAFIAYQLAVADLKRNTLYDFENDRSLVKQAIEEKPAE